MTRSTFCSCKKSVVSKREVTNYFSMYASYISNNTCSVLANQKQSSISAFLQYVEGVHCSTLQSVKSIKLIYSVRNENILEGVLCVFKVILFPLVSNFIVLQHVVPPKCNTLLIPEGKFDKCT